MSTNSATKIFVNLPVKDLPRSKEFFAKLGFTFNAQFTDDTGACMVVSEHAYVMLLTHENLKRSPPTPSLMPTRARRCWSLCPAKIVGRVNELVAKAVAAGGRTYNKPQDYGFMYGYGFQDLDGHVWEVFYMDPSHIKQG